MLIAVESFGIEERLSREILAFASQDLSDDAVEAHCRSLLDVLGLYLEFCRNVARIAPRYVSTENAEAAGVEIHHQLRQLLGMPSLPQKLAARIAEFASTLPTEVPSLSGYAYSRWVGFPHAGTWTELLHDCVGRAINALEVGSFEGRSACWLLSNVLTHEDATLTCIDAFEGPYFDRFMSNVSHAGGAHKVRTLRGRSHDLLPTLAPASFDLIYLDASSAARDEMTDCVLSARLLKAGGLLICDDYGGPAGWEPGVTRGIDHFLGAFGDDFDVVHSGFQIVLRKRA